MAPEAAALHTVPWELLREPGAPGNALAGRALAGCVLAADAKTPFSRYLESPSSHGRPVLARPIRVLVAVACPENLADYDLEPLAVADEVQALTAALTAAGNNGNAEFAAGIATTILTPPITLPQLQAALAAGTHVLHLVAHGRILRSGEAVIYLADAAQRVAPTSAQEFAGMVARSSGDLRLIFLATCQSGAASPSTTGSVLGGLAPALVQAGVPAVVAMNDSVLIPTARAFTTAFYQRLLEHGLVDLAANQARDALLAAPLPSSDEITSDEITGVQEGPAAASVPVLFLRLSEGRLLAQRGQVLGRQADSFWSTLLENIADGDCTPILGPGVTERLLPSPSDLATALASRYGYPFSDRQQLPRVAQYVATTEELRLRTDLLRLLAEGFRRWHGLETKTRPRQALPEAIAEVDWSTLSRSLHEGEIHHQLAELGLPLYLTTNWDSFMTLALAASGSAPRRLTVPWREAAAGASATPHPDLEPPASAAAPVVLHLFGQAEDPMSLVVTEDDALDFLALLARDAEFLIPLSVRAALARSTLLLLGFTLRDLDLKVLLRGILPRPEADRFPRLRVAVQLDADAGQDDAGEVRRYLESYFRHAKIDVYWGNTRQFVTELVARYKEFCHGQTR